MQRTLFFTLRAIAFVMFTISSAYAETTLNVWQGVAPGSEDWTWKEEVSPNEASGKESVGTVFDNVVTPTLTVLLPEHENASGTGIIIVPSGGCTEVDWDLEAYPVARSLQKNGVAAFVLKYRVPRKTAQGTPDNSDADQACKWGIADAIQSIKLVREHAAQWGISPDRIGIIGFSAGGMIASETTVVEDATARPNFAAFIYGAPFASMPPIPAKLPPIFMAWAQDDPAGEYFVRFYKALMTAGDKPEAHIYSAGGHGFAMKNQGTTSDHWLDQFYWWLEARGLARALVQKGGTPI